MNYPGSYVEITYELDIVSAMCCWYYLSEMKNCILRSKGADTRGGLISYLGTSEKTRAEFGLIM
jgi:hypothetical protein